MTFTTKLARFVTEAKSADIPEDACLVLRLSLLDWLAVGLAGATEPVSRICRDMVLGEGGTPRSTLFRCETRLPARAAALSNGTTSHALDYDDTHFAHIGHPSVAVISAALAVAEREEATGAELQAAALIGMEVSIRVGLWLGRTHYQTGFHQTATAGAFGATAACARLMGFDTDQTAAALGLTATRASGLKAQFGTMGKPFNAGIAAANGVEAATLIKKGFVPNPSAMEGPLGYGAMHAGEGSENALDGLGEEWLFTDVSHKFHACCHGLHATLEALETLKPVDPNTITRITIQTHPRWMTVCNQPSPTTGLEAKFSYRMVTAMSLLGHDTAAMSSYTDALCVDPDVVSLRNLVEVEPADTLTETQARVDIETHSTTRKAEFDLNAPMSLEDRTTRVRAKASALIGDDLTQTLWHLIEAKANPSDIARHMS